jgi:O-antigen/teichoic acid export membrane protein
MRLTSKSTKINIAANFLGQGWRVLMSLAFIPVYIKYLGIEAYGLIGLFAVFQAWLGLLDVGMKPALSRDMARFSGGAVSSQSIWNLLRSIECLGLMIAFIVTIVIWLVSGWLASEWVQASKIPLLEIARAFSLMGFVAALSFIENIYSSVTTGLRHQVVQNAISGISATLRGVGAAILLKWTPTITAFFLWQGLISIITILVFMATVYRLLPPSPIKPSFSKEALASVWRFAAGMTSITLLALLLTQADKILLSRLLPLDKFGYYTLAGVVAGGLTFFAAPISTALYPRFTELYTIGDNAELCQAYHHGAQLVSVLMGAAAMFIIFFSEKILLIWTNDPITTSATAPILSVLALGTLLNGLMWIPYQMQLAHGWTSLAIKINLIAVTILIPLIFIVVPKYGAIGAAWVWVSLNSGYVLLGMHFMYRDILKSEKWKWYHHDIFVPLVAMLATTGVFRLIIPENLSKPAELGILFISYSCVLITGALTIPMIRHHFIEFIRSKLKLTAAKILNFLKS